MRQKYSGKMRTIQLFKSVDGLSFEEKFKNTLKLITKESAGKPIVNLNIYLSSNNEEEFNDELKVTNKLLAESFDESIPASQIIAQKTSDAHFTIECMLCELDRSRIEYKKILKHPYVKINHENGFEILSGGICFNEESYIFSLQRSIDFAEQILSAEKINFKNIYKETNSIPNISNKCMFDGKEQSNYEIFSKLKELLQDNPNSLSDKNVISNGSDYGDFTTQFYAYKENSQNNINSISNILLEDNWFYLKAENTYNDVEKQTIFLLDKLNSLLTEKALVFNSIQLIKALVKNIGDFNKVEEILKSAIPTKNILVVQTDNIDDNLIRLEGLISNL